MASNSKEIGSKVSELFKDVATMRHIPGTNTREAILKSQWQRYVLWVQSVDLYGLTDAPLDQLFEKEQPIKELVEDFLEELKENLEGFWGTPQDDLHGEREIWLESIKDIIDKLFCLAFKIREAAFRHIRKEDQTLHIASSKSTTSSTASSFVSKEQQSSRAQSSAFSAAPEPRERQTGHSTLFDFNGFNMDVRTSSDGSWYCPKCGNGPYSASVKHCVEHNCYGTN